MALPSVADLKTHINIPSSVTADDDELGDVLDAAVEMVAALIGPLESGSVTEVYRGVNSTMLVLRRVPVTEVTAISARYGIDDTVPMTVTDFELDTDTGILRAISGARFLGDYVVTYSAGRVTLPASVRLAVLIVAAHLWETQRVPMQSEGPPGFAGGVEAMTTVSRGFALPNRALELLRPYMTVSLA